MKTFPYEGWVLSPTMRPHKVTVIGEKLSLHGYVFKTDDGRTFKPSEVYPTQFRAIEAGHAILDENQRAIDRKQKKLDARRVNLDKAHEKFSRAHA